MPGSAFISPAKIDSPIGPSFSLATWRVSLDVSVHPDLEDRYTDRIDVLLSRVVPTQDGLRIVRVSVHYGGYYARISPLRHGPYGIEGHSRSSLPHWVRPSPRHENEGVHYSQQRDHHYAASAPTYSIQQIALLLELQK